MSMDTNTAQISVKNLNAESFSLNPTALLSLFEIDVSTLGFNIGTISQSEIGQQINTIFRFHNNNKIGNNSIFWRGNEYVMIPISAEGFETNSKGTLPIPKLTLSVTEEGVPLLSILKDRINQLGGDLSGAKLTRIRTFAKYIDSQNFFKGVAPVGFSPDPNSEFPKDIYYIDRIVAQNKNYIQWELGSTLDIENVKLPARLVVTTSCGWTYRGFGCLYEYDRRRNSKIHGDSGDSILPDQAPPVATINDEFIPDLLGQIPYNDKGQYNPQIIYNKGDVVFLNIRGINYYFVGKKNNITVAPPDNGAWIADQCSKKLTGCDLRWGSIGDGSLPTAAFLSVNRYN